MSGGGWQNWPSLRSCRSCQDVKRHVPGQRVGPTIRMTWCRAPLERLTGSISCLAGTSPCGHAAIAASRLPSYPLGEGFRRLQLRCTFCPVAEPIMVMPPLFSAGMKRQGLSLPGTRATPVRRGVRNHQIIFCRDLAKLFLSRLIRINRQGSFPFAASPGRTPRAALRRPVAAARSRGVPEARRTMIAAERLARAGPRLALHASNGWRFCRDLWGCVRPSIEGGLARFRYVCR